MAPIVLHSAWPVDQLKLEQILTAAIDGAYDSNGVGQLRVSGGLTWAHLGDLVKLAGGHAANKRHALHKWLHMLLEQHLFISRQQQVATTH
jgi:hypothetical protein